MTGGTNLRRLVTTTEPRHWPFSKKREHWLYDEVHWQGGDGRKFTHLILLRNRPGLTSRIDAKPKHPRSHAIYVSADHRARKRFKNRIRSTR